jgi:hypothetical protein
MTEWSAAWSGRSHPGKDRELGVNRSGRKEYGRDLEADTTEELAIALLLQSVAPGRTPPVKFRHAQSNYCVTTGCVRLLNETRIPELLRNASNFATSIAVTILHICAWTRALYTQLQEARRGRC